MDVAKKRQIFFRGPNGLKMYVLTSFLEYLNEKTRCRKMGPLNVLTRTKNGAIVMLWLCKIEIVH
jgi:hypothetical protein